MIVERIVVEDKAGMEYQGELIQAENMFGQKITATATDADLEAIEDRAASYERSSKMAQYLEGLEPDQRKLATFLTAAFAVNPGRKLHVIRGALLRKAMDESERDVFAPDNYGSLYPTEDDERTGPVRKAVVGISLAMHETINEKRREKGKKELKPLSGEDVRLMLNQLSSEVSTMAVAIEKGSIEKLRDPNG